MPKHTAKHAQIGKERHMKKDISIIQIVTGFAATAAVVGLVIGSVALMSNLGKVPTQPGQAGSSGSETSSVPESSTTATQSQTQPSGNQNFLGGEGEIRVASGNLLYDDTYWYWEGCRTPVSDPANGKTEALPREAMERASALLNDGEQLYLQKHGTLFTIDSKGNETAFYRFESSDSVTYEYVTQLGTCSDVTVRDESPWYCISGNTTSDASHEPTYFAVAYQPETRKTLSLTDLMAEGNTALYPGAPVKLCGGTSICFLSADAKSVVTIPHPGALTSNYVALDWAPRAYKLTENGVIKDWKAGYDTIEAVVYTPGSTTGYTACRCWKQDSALEQKEIASGAPVAANMYYGGDLYVMTIGSGTDMTLMRIGSDGIGEETALQTLQGSSNGGYFMGTDGDSFFINTFSAGVSENNIWIYKSSTNELISIQRPQ